MYAFRVFKKNGWLSLFCCFFQQWWQSLVIYLAMCLIIFLLADYVSAESAWGCPWLGMCTVWTRLCRLYQSEWVVMKLCIKLIIVLSFWLCTHRFLVSNRCRSILMIYFVIFRSFIEKKNHSFHSLFFWIWSDHETQNWSKLVMVIGQSGLQFRE